MVKIRHYRAVGPVTAEPALALFQKQWQLYRKVVDYNYLFHREAYNCLHRILVEAVQPFRFLDVACGDASATVEALKGTQIASYHGIDLSQVALELASQALETLACPVTLDRRDFVEALRERPEPVDVAWIGLSLHHLLTPVKLSVMRQMRSVVGDRGLFLIYENASPDGEDRDAWLRRWDDQKPWWTALAPEEWDAGVAHVHANDFPETPSRWHALGREAGFGQVRELFVREQIFSGSTVLGREASFFKERNSRMNPPVGLTDPVSLPSEVYKYHRFHPELAGQIVSIYRMMFPHDGVPDEFYEHVVQKLEDKAAQDQNLPSFLSEGLEALNGQTGSAWTGLSENARLEALKRAEQTPFFQRLRSDFVLYFYSNPAIWSRFGYEGPSNDQGGYLHRGFNDIDWIKREEL